MRVNVARAMSHKLGSSKAVWSADSWFQESLTEEGVVCPYLMLILEGAADMSVDGRRRRLAPLRRQPRFIS